MSNKTRLQTNNTNLQALIDKANSLPDAGGSGGGGSVETCTVVIKSANNSTVSYVNNGQIVTEQIQDFTVVKNLTITKNTIMFIN